MKTRVSIVEDDEPTRRILTDVIASAPASGPPSDTVKAPPHVIDCASDIV